MVIVWFPTFRHVRLFVCHSISGLLVVFVKYANLLFRNGLSKVHLDIPVQFEQLTSSKISMTVVCFGIGGGGGGGGGGGVNLITVCECCERLLRRKSLDVMC